MTQHSKEWLEILLYRNRKRYIWILTALVPLALWATFFHAVGAFNQSMCVGVAILIVGVFWFVRADGRRIDQLEKDVIEKERRYAEWNSASETSKKGAI